MELIELEKEKTLLKIEELKDRRNVHAAKLEYVQLKTELLQNQAAVAAQPLQGHDEGNVAVQYLY